MEELVGRKEERQAEDGVPYNNMHEERTKLKFNVRKQVCVYMLLNPI